jgi:hypothetical protein
MRDGFLTAVNGWKADGFDALMARIDMTGDWLKQNGGPDSLGPDERETVVSMMASALDMGRNGAIPKGSARQ